jgi:putative transcriptional regulator
MTQKELARHIGVSRQTVNAIELNKYSPTLEVAFRIANVFGTSIENVFFYEPDIDGEHEFADRVEVEISWDGDEGGGIDNEGQ